MKHLINPVVTSNTLVATKGFRSKKDARMYWTLFTSLLALGLLASIGLLVYNNPIPIHSPSFIPVVRRRITALVAMLIAVICQSLGTITFQSITNNRVITPSLLGFEALYATIHTSIMFFGGVTSFLNFNGTKTFIFQIALMILMSLILYGWLLAGKYGNMQLMLLVGVIIGTGLRSLASFMRRLLAPSEFDLLQAKLFGSVNNADPRYFHLAIPIVLIVGALILLYSKRLNVLSLGKEVATTLGLQYKKESIYALVLVSTLMAVSTALVGPLTFYGFLVATLSYQLCPTYDHRYLFPLSIVIGLLILTGAYFLMYHVFSAQGVVSIIIEMVGGLTFLVLLLRRGAYD